jgi:uridine kinase
VVAVDGQGGAGKSSFASQLAAALGGCQIIHTDDFASWENSIDWWPELIERVLVPLARGEVAHFDSSQWESGALRPRIEIVPAEFLILEGVTASREAFRPWLTYSIWIEACRDLRLRRGLERDGEQARAQWERWIAEENGYRLRERPDERADLVVSGERDLWS